MSKTSEEVVSQERRRLCQVIPIVLTGSAILGPFAFSRRALAGEMPDAERELLPYFFQGEELEGLGAPKEVWRDYSNPNWLYHAREYAPVEFEGPVIKVTVAKSRDFSPIGEMRKIIDSETFLLSSNIGQIESTIEIMKERGFQENQDFYLRIPRQYLLRTGMNIGSIRGSEEEIQNFLV